MKRSQYPALETTQEKPFPSRLGTAARLYQSPHGWVATLTPWRAPQTCLVGMKANCMGGEMLGADVDLACREPRDQERHRDDEREPKSWEFDEERT